MPGCKRVQAEVPIASCRLLPQEASYYALRLPQGWWLFGLDLALVDDIDMSQCRCAQ